MLKGRSLPVPKQLPLTQAKVIAAVTETAQSTVSAGVPSSILANVLLGVSLKSIWQAINITSFLIYSVKWRLSPPSNMETF